jgi:glycosyltransferase involved in cell wall biosynthesis
MGSRKLMDQFDVVVPCYNYGRYLRGCVESVLSQDGVSVRVLIIDDASPDDTADVGQRLALEDNRVQFRRHVRNVKNIATYNEGIDWAQGDYFLILSADDYLLSGAFRRAAAVFKEHPDVVLTCGQAIISRDDELFQVHPPGRQPAGFQLFSGRTFMESLCADSSNNPIWSPTAVIRTSAQKRAGGYSVKIPHAGDLEMWLRLACLGSIAVLNSFQAVYRRHSANMHLGYAGLHNLQQHLLAFESAFADFASDIDDREVLQKRYRRGLAMGAIRAANHALHEGDNARYQEAVSFATDVYPTIRRTLNWQEMRFRRLIGPRGVTLLRKALSAVRPRSSAQRATW